MAMGLSINLFLVTLLVGSTYAQTEGQIRLQGGTRTSQGRVEIYHSGQWGTVCDDSFDVMDARVVCRQIGQPNSNPRAYQSARFGQGRGRVWMDNLMCIGTEARLTACRHNGWGIENCNHAEDASVDCNPAAAANIPVRLVSGNSTVTQSGRLEIQYQGQWGTVCDRRFTVAAATVVCRQLGVTNGRGVPIPSAYYGAGTGRVLLDNVRCTGTEAGLGSCMHSNWGRTSCRHNRDVSIICLPAGRVQPADVQLRLNGGLSAYNGRLEIAYKGIWGTVCNVGFSTADATYFCGAMNLTGAARVQRSFALSGQGPIWFENPQCRGNETHFLDCISKPFGNVSSYCYHARDTVLECSTDSRPAYPIRLMQGNASYDGRVELNIGGRWGTVCDTRWTTAEATVACRQAVGLVGVGAVPVRTSYYGSAAADVPVYLQNVRCRGTELSLSQCNHQYSAISATCRTHRRDAGVVCYPAGNLLNMPIRLVDGYSNYTGRVEILYQGVWGTICGDYWSSTDARVICRMLGIETTRARGYFNHGMFPIGSGRIWLDNVNCRGTETHIALCPHYGFGRSNGCTHQKDASVVCPGGPRPPAPQVRLVNGTTRSEGRVEVSFNNGQTWGTICDDGWSMGDARVICRMLGFPISMAVTRNRAYFGQGTGKIVYTNVRCSGTEGSISQCYKTAYNIRGCDHREDAGVVCQSIPTGVDVRLVGGADTNIGRVEIAINNTWGTVCDDSFNNAEAQVVCRMLGFLSNGSTVMRTRQFGAGTGPIYLDDLRCRGDESSLLLCLTKEIGNEDCSHSEDVAVQCNNGAFMIRLMKGRSVSRDTTGRVEVSFGDNRWGTVCNDYFDRNAAKVVCRMLGFPVRNAVATSYTAYGRGAGPIMLDDIRCTGNETSLMNCRHLPPRSHNCGHSEDVGVMCLDTTNISSVRTRLYGGTRYKGYVQVYFNRQWGAVCPTYFNNIAAMVVCRSIPNLRNTVRARTTSRSGMRTLRGLSWLDRVRCVGNETNLAACRHRAWGETRCSLTSAVVVTCETAAMLNTRVRLVDGSNANEGRVEVYKNRQWFTVCDNIWDPRDARVVCRQLSLPTTYVIAAKNSLFGRGTLRPRLNNFACTGSEPSLGYCTSRAWTRSTCLTYGYAGVMCLSAEPTITAMRLSGGRTIGEGRVEVQALGRWGTICRNGFGNVDAAVVCRQLGYSGGISRPSRRITVRGFYWFQGLACRGNEQNIAACRHQAWGQHSCSSTSSAVVQCAVTDPWNVTVRLVNGPSPREGRVEVLYAGQWGTVCDDSWDDVDAAVVCRQLGFSTEGALSRRRAAYGRGTGPIYFDDVRCRGLETKLGQCAMNQITLHNCNHGEDAGVRCRARTEPHLPVQISLSGGTSYSGTVRMFYNNTWGTICDDYWSAEDAQVICRMLNLPSEGAIPRLQATYGQGNGSIFFDDVMCIGNETSILECPHRGFYIHNCAHIEDAGVVCQSGTATRSRIRLVGGGRPYQGRIEIQHNGTWGTVCDDRMSIGLARVACRHAGYTTSTPQLYNRAYYGQGAFSSRIWLDEVNCRGTERSLDQCAHQGWGQNDCSHGEDLSVSCPPIGGEQVGVRLSGGQGPFEGRVELQIRGTWGTICDDNFDNYDAQVICNMLQYTRIGAYARQRASLFGQGSGPIYLDEVGCRGMEANIMQCPASRTRHDCTHNEDASVHCAVSGTGTVRARLINGPNSNEGIVQVSINNTWGSICLSSDISSRVLAARVLCRMLSKPSGNGVMVVPNSLYRRRTGPIFLSNVLCEGYESNVMRCSHRNIMSTPFCSHAQDMAIRCSRAIPITTSPRITTPAPTPNPLTLFVRLSGGDTANQGRVEVFYQNAFGTVCDDNWGDPDAQVVCSMLGYQRSGSRASAEGAYGPGSGNIWVDEVNCRGTERSIAQCPTANGWVAHDCYHGEDAGVICSTGSSLNNFLIVTDSSHHHVYRMDLSTYSYTEIPHDDHSNPVAIGYDHSEQKLYWSDVQSNLIKTSNIDGSNAQILIRLPNHASPDGLAVDPISRNLFFTDTGTKTITVTTLDGLAYKALITSDLDEPRGIAVHPGRGYVFWTDWSATHPRIERANMDGSARTQLVTTDIVWPNGIVIDYAANLIYWTDGSRDTIKKADFDGQNVLTIVTEIGQLFGLAIVQNYIYYTDWAESNIKRVSKNGVGKTAVGPTTFGRLNALTAYKAGDGIETLNATNGCTNARGHCSHICVPLPNNLVTCLCPDPMVLGANGKTCASSSPCLRLIAPSHGSITPAECTSSASNTGKTCTIACDTGYQVLGPASVQCLANSQWSHYGATFICTDIAVPTVTCPPTITVDAPMGKQVAVITYPAIVATDNSNQPVITVANPPTGSTFNTGNSIVTVRVTDVNHLSAVCTFTVTVNVVRCGQQTNLPSHLKITLGTCPTDHYGATCAVMCDRGYQQQGPLSITCDKVNNQPQWALNGASCQATPCPALTAPASGSITPVTCTGGPSNENSACIVSCNTGYTLNGAKRLVCQSTGDWSNLATALSCRDTSRPVLSCPTPMTVIADKGGISKQVDWRNQISKSDNSGKTLTITQNPASPITLREGTHTVTITATDQATNQAMCSFTVQVNVLRCGPPITGPQMLTPSCETYYGATCDLACRSGYKLSGTTSRIACDKAAPADTTVQWIPASVSCQPMMCPTVTPPENGAMSGCGRGSQSPHTICKFTCNAGYSQAGGSVNSICKIDGTWSDAQLICAKGIRLGQSGSQSGSSSSDSNSNTSTLVLAVFLGLIIVCLIAVISFFAYKRLVFMKRGTSGVYELSPPPDKGSGIDNPSYSQANF